MVSISQSIRRRWGLERNEALDELERHQEKKELNAEHRIHGEEERGFWGQELREKRAES